MAPVDSGVRCNAEAAPSATGRDTLLAAVLVAEDDGVLRERLLAQITSLGGEHVVGCSSARQCIELLHALQPSLLVLDFQLEDGSASVVLEALAALEEPPTILVVTGSVAPDAAFALATSGVDAFIAKPLGPADVDAAIDALAAGHSSLRRIVRRQLGKASLFELQEEVRDTLLDEALSRTEGNRRSAARLLRVSRQVVQHMVRAWGERESSRPR